MIVHRYEPKSFKPIEIPDEMAKHPVSLLIMERVKNGKLACWRVGFQYAHLCSVTLLANGETECFVSCSPALVEDPWAIFFEEHMATMYSLEKLQTMREVELQKMESAKLLCKETARAREARACKRWKWALAEVLWKLRLQSRPAQLATLLTSIKAAKDSYCAAVAQCDRLKNRLDRNPHSHNYKARFPNQKSLMAHYRSIYRDTDRDHKNNDLYQQHRRELALGTRLLRNVCNSLTDKLHVLCIREAQIKREWLFQALFPDDDDIDERLYAMGLTKMATANRMNYHTMAQFALSACWKDIDTWREFEIMLTRRELDSAYHYTQLGKLIARGLPMPRAYWKEHLQKRDLARKRWQCAIRTVMRQARADKKDTTRNAANAAARRAVRAAANQEERPERAYTASGPSHRPPTVKWPKEAPNAGERAKKLAEFAASREAAKAVKVAKRARADREKLREQNQLRNLAIGHAILDDQ